MRLRFASLSIALGLFTVSAHASAPPAFSLVEVGYGSSDPYGFDLDGFDVHASVALNERFFIGATYGNYDGEQSGFDIDTDVVSLRVGIMQHHENDITFYAGPEFTRAEYTFMGDSNSHNGYGGFAGMHNQISERLSLNFEAAFTRLFNQTSFAVDATLRYYVTPSISFAASTAVGSYQGYSVNAAYHF